MSTHRALTPTISGAEALLKDLGPAARHTDRLAPIRKTHSFIYCQSYQTAVRCQLKKSRLMILEAEENEMKTIADRNHGINLRHCKEH